jgi:cell division protein FtsQ
VVKRVILDAPKGELKHVTLEQVRAALGESLTGTVFSADLQQVHQSLQSIPWVHAVTVRRIWPSRLHVRIEEQQAVGIWSANTLVNRHGELFAAHPRDHMEPCSLVKLSGPDGSERLVTERARQLTAWLAPMKAPLRSVTLSEQYSWTAEVAGITVDLGRDALPTPVQERVRMFAQTHGWLVDKLQAQGENGQLLRADLRYATGYAFQAPTRKPAVAAAVAAKADPAAQEEPKPSCFSRMT